MWKDKYLYSKIGIENHVNYAKFDDEELLVATYILLKSRFYNRYFKIINGTTQVNVSDLNHLPVPPVNDLKVMGGKFTRERIGALTSKDCDDIVNEYLKNIVGFEEFELL